MSGLSCTLHVHTHNSMILMSQSTSKLKYPFQSWTCNHVHVPLPWTWHNRRKLFITFWCHPYLPFWLWLEPAPVSSHSVSVSSVTAFRGSMKLTFSPFHGKWSIGGYANVKQTSKSCNFFLTSVNCLLFPDTSFVMSGNRESLEPSHWILLPSPSLQSKRASFQKSYESGWWPDEVKHLLQAFIKAHTHLQLRFSYIHSKSLIKTFPSRAPETWPYFQIFLSVQRVIHWGGSLC